MLSIPNFRHTWGVNQSAVDRETLIRLRQARGWTTNRLARESGVGHAALWRIEQGRALNPRAETVQRLAAALGVPAEQLAPGPAPDHEERIAARVVERVTPTIAALVRALIAEERAAQRADQLIAEAAERADALGDRTTVNRHSLKYKTGPGRAFGVAAAPIR